MVLTPQGVALGPAGGEALEEVAASRPRQPCASVHTWFTGHTKGAPYTQPRASAPALRGAQRSWPLQFL